MCKNIILNLFVAMLFLNMQIFGKVPNINKIEGYLIDHPQSQENHSKIKIHKKVGVIEMTLNNGMKVILKPTDFEDDEVCIRLTAKGGYASLSENKKPSGMIAADIAWESGICGYSSDKLQALLYEYSIEMSPRILPYSRIIEGTSINESLEKYFELVNSLFTQHQFQRDAFERVIDQYRDSIKKRPNDHDLTFEDAYLALNTENYYPLKPLSLQDLNRVEFSIAHYFFQRCFSEPSEFVCVITGSFDPDQIKPLIIKYLGNIPKRKFFQGPENPIALKFPNGVTHKSVHLHNRKEFITRLTFPVVVNLDQSKLKKLDLTCQLIETRLRGIIKRKMKTTQGLDVAYEFPQFPELDTPWVAIQFSSDTRLNKQIIQLILQELKSLQDDGPTPQEINTVKELLKNSDSYWMHDNNYWISALTNYTMWGWDPDEIVMNYDDPDLLDKEKLREVIEMYISFDDYTILTAIP